MYLISSKKKNSLVVRSLKKKKEKLNTILFCFPYFIDFCFKSRSALEEFLENGISWIKKST